MMMNLMSAQEKTFLDQLSFLNSLAQDDGEEEVCEFMDFIQASDEEKKALDDFVTYSMRMSTWFGEWEPEHWQHPLGDVDRFNKWHTKLLDEAEMNRDMEIFEEFEACHDLFASAPWAKRKPGKTGVFNPVTKRSELSAWGELVAIGDSYGTVLTHLGKAFLPKYLLSDDLKLGDVLCARVQFKGFSPAPGVSMPWRVLKIESNEGPSDKEATSPRISEVNGCVAVTHHYDTKTNDNDMRASKMADEFLTQMDDVKMWPTLA
jgi:hypothetical protein